MNLFHPLSLTECWRRIKNITMKNTIQRIFEFFDTLQFPNREVEAALIIVSILFCPVIFLNTSLGNYLEMIWWSLNFYIHLCQYNRRNNWFNAVSVGLSLAFTITSFVMIFIL